VKGIILSGRSNASKLSRDGLRLANDDVGYARPGKVRIEETGSAGRISESRSVSPRTVSFAKGLVSRVESTEDKSDRKPMPPNDKNVAGYVS
jgi:hypothetical protein